MGIDGRMLKWLTSEATTFGQSVFPNLIFRLQTGSVTQQLFSDSAMRLVPNIEELHLNENRLRTVANLSSLHHLNHLNLNGNLIESIKDWHLELGNIETLNLSGNKLKELKGLSRLRSLRTINLSWNQISDFNEIDEIASLPVVENVMLNGNPLILEVDYRAKVLTRFDERSSEILLDNEKCSQNEIDKALVLSALRKTKIGPI